jgi:hypothetical protein
MRELRNVLERPAAMAASEILDAKLIEQALPPGSARRAPSRVEKRIWRRPLPMSSGAPLSTHSP